ncbi:MAG: HAMP domain-containing histidine kinase [Anaerolineales bacterium]|nr:HAMP domain-containing histidine kinase [Anaerolineales bacterium]MCB8950580.1 HAMP domain-containing histidine kinase [Ardenticatenales bacterium]
MNLTQQFLLLSIIPAAFVALLLYGRRATARTRRPAARPWALTLVLSAFWSSTLLSYFGGATLPLTAAFTWRVVGAYALSLSGLGLLLTTLALLETPWRGRLWLIIASGALWLAAVGLDPAIWSYHLSTIFFRWGSGGYYWRHFDMWAGVWVLSGLVPAFSAWLINLRFARHLPQSQSRTQITYWLLALTLFLLALLPACARLPGQPGLPQLGALIWLLAALLGTLTLTHTPLPEIRLSGRQIVALLIDAAVIFIIALLGLWFLSQQVGSLSLRGQLLTAGLFALLILLGLRLVQQMRRRWFHPLLNDHSPPLAATDDLSGALFDPPALGRWLLYAVQTTVQTKDVWLYTCADGPGGRLLLRPLVASDAQTIPSLTLLADNPFVQHLRQQAAPIVQYDIDTVGAFAGMDPEERQLIRELQRHLYMPLHAGSRLVGLLALAAKDSRRPYDRFDYLSLQTLASQVAPLLQQALTQASLYQLAYHAFAQHHAAAHTGRYQAQWQALQRQFFDLIQPETLRQPLQQIDQSLRQRQEQFPDEDMAATQRQVNELRHTLDGLIGAKVRLERLMDFQFAPVQFDQVLRDVVNALTPMAAGRRVQVTTEIATALPPIYGDRQRLAEAVRGLLHNAIKFNRIGGQVNLHCALETNEIALHISDTGVGIPPDRLDDLWEGFQRTTAPRVTRVSGNDLQMGLPITRFIILSHGGRITAVSEYGSGSTFSSYLPIIYSLPPSGKL